MTREEQIEIIAEYLVDKFNEEVMEVWDYSEEHARYIGITMDEVQELIPAAYPDWDKVNKVAEKVLIVSPWIMTEIDEYYNEEKDDDE